MKGLLHRLAARAAGTAVTVRSDARLPFGAGHGAAFEPDAGEDRLATAGAPAALQDGVAGGSLAPDAAPAEPAASGAPAPADAPARRGPAHEPPPDAGQPAASRATLLPPVEPADASAPRLPPRLVDPSPAEASRQRHEPAGEVTRTHRAGDAAPHASPAGHRPDGAWALPAPMAASPHAEPPRLMPATAPRPLPMPTPPPAALAALAAGRAAEEPNEVHVHIGRIDVTAVQEQAAPRRRSPAAPAPMSLDAYFARRSRP